MIAFFSDLHPAPAFAMNDRTTNTPPDSPAPGESTPTGPFAKTLLTRYLQRRLGAEEVIDVKSYSSEEGPGVEIDLPRGTWSFSSPAEIDAFAATLKKALAVDPFPETTTPAGSPARKNDHPGDGDSSTKKDGRK